MQRNYNFQTQLRTSLVQSLGFSIGFGIMKPVVLQGIVLNPKELNL